MAKNVYSVKVWDSSVGWVHQYMTRDLNTAKRLASDEKQLMIKSGYLPRVKIVHPAKETIQAFLAAGNTLR